MVSNSNLQKSKFSLSVNEQATLIRLSTKLVRFVCVYVCICFVSFLLQNFLVLSYLFGIFLLQLIYSCFLFNSILMKLFCLLFFIKQHQQENGSPLKTVTKICNYQSAFTLHCIQLFLLRLTCGQYRNLRFCFYPHSKSRQNGRSKRGV